MKRPELAKPKPEQVPHAQSANTTLPPGRRSQHLPLPLQRQLGNQAMGSLLQAKFRVNEPGDQYEQQAAQVTQMAEPGVFQRGEPAVTGKPFTAEDSSSASFNVPSKSGGQPLPEDVKARMELAFGADFSSVRIHEGGDASAIGALAYTRGTDIHFAPGQYRPETHSGRELLGHELAHVVQQSQGRVRATTQESGVAINDDGSLEREADELGGKAARGDRANAPAGGTSGSAHPPVQRKGMGKLPWSMVDVTYNAWYARTKNVDEALAKTKRQIGGSFPEDYVPPQRRGAQQPALPSTEYEDSERLVTRDPMAGGSSHMGDMSNTPLPMLGPEGTDGGGGSVSVTPVTDSSEPWYASAVEGMEFEQNFGYKPDETKNLGVGLGFSLNKDGGAGEIGYGFSVDKPVFFLPPVFISLAGSVNGYLKVLANQEIRVESGVKGNGALKLNVGVPEVGAVYGAGVASFEGKATAAKVNGEFGFEKAEGNVSSQLKVGAEINLLKLLGSVDEKSLEKAKDVVSGKGGDVNSETSTGFKVEMPLSKAYKLLYFEKIKDPPIQYGMGDEFKACITAVHEVLKPVYPGIVAAVLGPRPDDVPSKGRDSLDPVIAGIVGGMWGGYTF